MEIKAGLSDNAEPRGSPAENLVSVSLASIVEICAFLDSDDKLEAYPTLDQQTSGAVPLRTHYRKPRSS